jgi:hypothetical protein
LCSFRFSSRTSPPRQRSPLLPHPLLCLGSQKQGRSTIYSYTDVCARFETYSYITLPLFLLRIFRFSLWDLGGQTTLRSSWSQYHAGTAAVILVVDSTDRARLGLVREELNKLLEAEVSRLRFDEASLLRPTSASFPIASPSQWLQYPSAPPFQLLRLRLFVHRVD